MPIYVDVRADDLFALLGQLGLGLAVCVLLPLCYCWCEGEGEGGGREVWRHGWRGQAAGCELDMGG